MFKGLSAFPLTPASAEGVVDTDAFQRLISRLVPHPVASIGLLGSTGTYAYLTRAERRRAVAAAVEVLVGKVPLIVGVGAMRTDEAVALAQDAAAEGADAVLMALVSYTPLTQDEAFEHYRAVTTAAGLPMCVYNNPGTTHFTFSEELVQRLAEVDGIAAVKMPLPADGDFAGESARLGRDGFEIGYSADWGIADALLGGAGSFYSAVAGTLPKQVTALSSRSCRASRRWTSQSASWHKWRAVVNPKRRSPSWPCSSACSRRAPASCPPPLRAPAPAGGGPPPPPRPQTPTYP